MSNSNKLVSSAPKEDHWISISDLMSGLMIIFIFIAISYMVKIRKQNEGLIGISETYTNEIAELYNDLYEEFKKDIPTWNIEIDSVNLVIRFKEPDVLFKGGDDEIQEDFKKILTDFFPRYIDVLTSEKHKENIEGMRIEGHTSSEGKKGMSKEQSYYYNMSLSQRRTSNVLDYVLRHNKKKYLDDWIRRRLVAVGYSSSKLIMKINNNGEKVEDTEQSRRVEFRAYTRAHERILQLLELGRSH